MDYLRSRYIMDPPPRRLPLDLATRRLIHNCRDWSETLPRQCSQVTDRAERCCSFSVLHGCGVLVCGFLDQLCRGLQREDACQYTQV
jgi:hypothetical protein